MRRLFSLPAASLFAAAIAFAVARGLGGPRGMGVLAGFGLGAGLSGLGVLYLAHVLRTRPERALRVSTALFLVKLGCLLVGGIALRNVPGAEAVADWQSFLLAYAAATAWIVPVGTLEITRTPPREVRS